MLYHLYSGKIVICCDSEQEKGIVEQTACDNAIFHVSETIEGMKDAVSR